MPENPRGFAARKSYTNRWQKCLRPLESRYRAPIQAIFCQPIVISQ